MDTIATAAGWIHEQYVFGRRVRRLAAELAAIIPESSTVLDVGCGDGSVARCLSDLRPDVSVRGLEVLVRDGAHIPVEWFDGSTIPCADASVDVVLLVDVLHHTDDPSVLLREAVRVARHAVVLKDHTLDGVLAGPTLRFMDWVGNSRYGVALPYNYWPRARWLRVFQELGLRIEVWRQPHGLYPAPASWLFERSLHFVALLAPAPSPVPASSAFATSPGL